MIADATVAAFNQIVTAIQPLHVMFQLGGGGRHLAEMLITTLTGGYHGNGDAEQRETGFPLPPIQGDEGAGGDILGTAVAGAAGSAKSANPRKLTLTDRTGGIRVLAAKSSSYRFH